MLSRLDRIECFIDWLEEYVVEELYNHYQMLEEDMYMYEEAAEWAKYNLTCVSDLDGLCDEFNSTCLEVYFGQEYWADLKDCFAGIQQYCFVFNDGEVWKISSENMVSELDYLKNSLPKQFHCLFPKMEMKGEHEHCYIYTQEKVDETGLSVDLKYRKEASSKGLATSSKTMSGLYNFSDGLYSAIALKYGEKWCEELCEALCKSGYEIDLHGENWGVTNDGRILLIDPIYQNV